MFVVQSFGGVAVNVNLNSNGWREHLLWAMPSVGGGLVATVFAWLALSWLSVGYFRSIRRVMRTGQAEFEDVVKPGDLWIPMVLTRAVQGLLMFGAALPFAVPPTFALMLHKGLGLHGGISVGIAILGVLAYIPCLVYISLGLVFMPHATALEGLSVGDSIKRSWELASGHRWWILLFSLATVAISLVGFMLCCVGILPATILIQVMLCEAYVQATDIVGDSEEWWIESQTSYANRARSREFQSPAPPASTPAPPASDEPFDPGRWRGDADIPPIDEGE